MCLMLCAPLDWQYAELPSSASDAVCGTSNEIEKEKKMLYSREEYKAFI